MDFDVRDASVREALHDLQFKVKDLEQERDHIIRLERHARQTHELHRQELTQLVLKERAISAAKEDAVRAELQRALAECRTLHDQVNAKQHEFSRRVSSRLAAERKHAQTSNVRQRVEMDDVEDALKSVRDDCEAAEKAMRECEGTVERLKKRHAELHETKCKLEEAQRRRKEKEEEEEEERAEKEEQNRREEERRMREEEEEEEERCRRMKEEEEEEESSEYMRGGGGDEETVEMKGCGVRHPEYYRRASPRRRLCDDAFLLRLRRPFLPSGLADRERSITPATHNIGAVVSTIERWNRVKPREFLRRLSRSRSRSREKENAMLHALDRQLRIDALVSPPRSSHSPSHSRATRGRFSRHASPALTPSRSMESTRRGSQNMVDKKHWEQKYRRLLEQLLHAREEYDQIAVFLDLPMRYATSGRSGRRQSVRGGRSKSRTRGGRRRGERDVNVNDDTVALSRRMREIMKEIEFLIDELRCVHRQEVQAEKDGRFHNILVEIARENDYCESMYKDLLYLLRATSL